MAMSRYDPIEAPVVWMVRVFKNGKAYDQHPRPYSMDKMRGILARYRRRGGVCKAWWMYAN